MTIWYHDRDEKNAAMGNRRLLQLRRKHTGIGIAGENCASEETGLRKDSVEITEPPTKWKVLGFLSALWNGPRCYWLSSKLRLVSFTSIMRLFSYFIFVDCFRLKGKIFLLHLITLAVCHTLMGRFLHCELARSTVQICVVQRRLRIASQISCCALKRR